MMFRVVGFIKRMTNEFYYNLKLKYRLIISFSLFIIFPILLIGLSSYYISQKNMIDAEKKSLLQNASQLNNTIDFFLETYMNKNEMLFNSVDLQSVMVKRNSSLTEALESQKRINNILKQVENDFRYPEMKSSYYYGGNIDLKIYAMNESLTEFGGEIMSFRDILDEKWCREFFSTDKQYAWQYISLDGANAGSSGHVIYNRKLVDFNTASTIGLLRLYIPLVRIENILKEYMHNTLYSVMYVDQNYALIAEYGDSTGNSELLGQIRTIKLKAGINTTAINGQQYIICCIDSNITSWKSILLAPVSYIVQKTRYIATITVITIFLSLFMCVIIATLVSSFMTKRINILVGKTNSIKDGNFSLDTVIKGNDEIGQLDKNFNKMIKRIDDLILSDYKLQIAMDRVRYEMLQEQINPHLLYNTLAMISMIAKKTNQAEIMDISNSLVNFYKGVLNKGRFISTIREEIEMLKRYIEITKFVYRLELETVFDIDDGLLDLYSIKLFLQPILENSILHGVRPNGGGTIQVMGRRYEDRVEFVITDDGVGINADTLEFLNSVAGSVPGEKCYGISNVKNRIQLIFGSGFGVSFESTPGFGTSATVIIPALDNEGIAQILDAKYLS